MTIDVMDQVIRSKHAKIAGIIRGLFDVDDPESIAPITIEQANEILALCDEQPINTVKRYTYDLTFTVSVSGMIEARSEEEAEASLEYMTLEISNAETAWHEGEYTVEAIEPSEPIIETIEVIE